MNQYHDQVLQRIWSKDDNVRLKAKTLRVPTDQNTGLTGGSGSGRPRMETQSEFFFCSGAATEVLKVGSFQLSGEKVLLLLIPGNPGVVGFYESFMRTLHGLLGRPVWAVSHAGHCAPPDSMDLVEDGAAAARQDVFGLDGQIRHKLAFIQDRVPRGTRLVLVGHSIGCYMILEMMRRSPELEVLKAVLLFPTIERMAQSPQGKVMTPVLCQLRYLAYLPLFLMSLLPQRVAALLLRLLLRGVPALDPCVLRPSLDMFSGDCAGGFYRVSASGQHLSLYHATS
ncbi:lipid droplet-associated hydrolase isoform X1 [Poecilia latipinna]|uniref:lipid droplet-associated hydrolase isoform X1 n=3 Tax=Poecilia latipinna TaxID=48699 RepID=UPI00072E801B|nr:PREDICTED: lipid droplet-associated hydrolase-like isoform X1 [Poecilia latipinna]